MKNVTMLTQSVQKICRLPDPTVDYAGSLLKSSIASEVADDIDQTYRKGSLWMSQLKVPKLAQLKLNDTVKDRLANYHPYSIVFYQRDDNRRFVNLELFQSKLEMELGLQPGPYRWNITTIVHNSRRSPCELVAILQKATVFVTPHGFQSTLSLFLPPVSVLVEVFPAWFYKPFVYGSIIASMRNIGLFSKYYLCDLSPSVPSWITSFREYWWSSYRNQSSLCLHSPFCRYVARKGDVYLTDTLLHRLTKFIHSHF